MLAAALAVFFVFVCFGEEEGKGGEEKKGGGMPACVKQLLLAFERGGGRMFSGTPGGGRKGRTEPSLISFSVIIARRAAVPFRCTVLLAMRRKKKGKGEASANRSMGRQKAFSAPILCRL